jgi:MauM/NapG family ferredoxin protein
VNPPFAAWLRRLAAPPPLRPPGARDEQTFAALCIRCDRCVAVCPYRTLKPAGWAYGPEAGTPVLVVRDVPCWLCMLCPPACPTGALAHVRDARAVRIGLARVDVERCYAFQGILCRTCVDECPYPGDAIFMDGELRPIVTEKCVGCGICEHRCPADGSAIRVAPRGSA